MHSLPFGKPGTFYRGNLHTHSTRSDGTRTPEQVVDDYRSRGYDFISITDHFLPAGRYHEGASGFVTVSDLSDLDCDGFVTMPGAELHGPAMENGQIWHFVAVGLPVDFPELGPDEGGTDVARRGAETGAFVALAHPHWNAVSEIDALSVADFIDSVEVYNHASEVGVRRGYGLHQADVLLAKEHRISFCATDDAHFQHPRGAFMDAFGGWVQVKAEALTADALLTALKAGEFYSSTGPEFHNIEIDNGTIRIACSPVEDIVVSGRGAGYQRFHDSSMIEATAPLPNPENAPYVRVTIVDADGHAAWSNPIWLDR